MSVALAVKSGKHAGRRIPVPRGQLLFGRDEQCQIKLSSTDVSRVHCRIVQTSKGAVVAEDLGSHNGTYVNGKQIEGRVRLKNGDELRVGPMAFTVQIGKKTKAKMESQIADWLSDDGEGAEVKESDTTTRTAIPTPKPDAASVSRATPATARRQTSIAEEAQDIIRRHLESQSDADQAAGVPEEDA